MLNAEDIRDIFTDRPVDSVKNDFGYIALIGGCMEYSGAPRLAEMAASAMRSGCGVCMLAVPKTLCPLIAPQILESTLYPLSDDGEGHFVFNENELKVLCEKCRAIGFGMGMGPGEDVQKALRYLLENYHGKLVIDADGLNALARMDCRGLYETKADVVITPHLKEFSRLLKMTELELSANDPKALAVDFARRSRCTVLLKGSTTRVTDGMVVCDVDRGCPGMATAGSGDVLSGILTAILAYSKERTALTTAAAAYVNGLAGELAQENSCACTMIASDTASNIKKAIETIVEEN